MASPSTDAWLLGAGGWLASDTRETTCVLLRRGDHALVLDAGSGLRRLATDPALLDGVARVDLVLTHFHFDHLCGLPAVAALEVPVTLWAPGHWLYDTPSETLLGPLRAAPLSAFEAERLGTVRELEPGGHALGPFSVRTRAQPRHWAPTAGLRIDDALALITDTAYDPGTAGFVAGVDDLLHEAWSPSSAPRGAEGDATGRDAGRVARDAGVARLTLVHLHPLAGTDDAVLADARGAFPAAELGRDGARLLGA